MNIRFHCDVPGTFQNGQQMRSFLYSNYRIKPHTHDFYEMNIVLAGTGTHRIEEASVEVCTGDVFVIPPMASHAYENTRNLDVYHMLLQKEFVEENRRESSAVPGFVQLTEIEPFLRRSGGVLNLHLSAGQLLRLKDELSVLEDETNSLPLRKHTVWKILYWLSALLDAQLREQKRGIGKYDSVILDTLEYIHGNFGEKITTEDLSRRVFLSRATFLRSFGSMCACTPMQYLSRYRCKMAVQMLESGKLSRTEVAHACGFYDLSHMDRSMKNAEKGRT